jgi:hypothetical protein
MWDYQDEEDEEAFLSEWEDDDGGFDDCEDVEIDYDEIMNLAEKKRKFHFACTLGPQTETASDLFFAEAELLLNAGDYKSALVAAVAADHSASSSLRRGAIECICVYQLGSRSAALKIADIIQHAVEKSDLVSSYLRTRFANTVEVLRFMPELLGMLSARGRKNYS